MMEYFEGDAPEKTYKIILVGHARVGKTSIINRYMNDNFNDNEAKSNQMQIMNKLVKVDRTQDTWVQLNIWDTLGQEKYQSLSPIFFRKAIGVFLVFDCTSMESFSKLDGWFDKMAECIDSQVLVMLLGNKSDLPHREVPYNLAMEYARNRNFGYLEVSAKSGVNIKNAFNCLVREIYKNQNKDKLKADPASNPFIDKTLTNGSKDQRGKGKSIKLNSQLHLEAEDERDSLDKKDKKKSKKEKKDKCEKC